MRLFISCLALIALAVPAMAGEGVRRDRGGPIVLAQLGSETPEQKLQKLLRPHFYDGGHVTDDIRAATGDPNIPVIDRRWRWGEVYSCNYIFLQGGGKGRALVCE